MLSARRAQLIGVQPTLRTNVACSLGQMIRQLSASYLPNFAELRATAATRRTRATAAKRVVSASGRLVGLFRVISSTGRFGDIIVMKIVPTTTREMTTPVTRVNSRRSGGLTLDLSGVTREVISTLRCCEIDCLLCLMSVVFEAVTVSTLLS